MGGESSATVESKNNVGSIDARNEYRVGVPVVSWFTGYQMSTSSTRPRAVSFIEMVRRPTLYGPTASGATTFVSGSEVASAEVLVVSDAESCLVAASVVDSSELQPTASRLNAIAIAEATIRPEPCRWKPE